MYILKAGFIVSHQHEGNHASSEVEAITHVAISIILCAYACLHKTCIKNVTAHVHVHISSKFIWQVDPSSTSGEAMRMSIGEHPNQRF